MPPEREEEEQEEAYISRPLNAVLEVGESDFTVLRGGDDQDGPGVGGEIPE